jgi:hypothetical protein
MIPRRLGPGACGARARPRPGCRNGDGPGGGTVASNGHGDEDDVVAIVARRLDERPAAGGGVVTSLSAANSEIRYRPVAIMNA